MSAYGDGAVMGRGRLAVPALSVAAPVGGAVPIRQADLGGTAVSGHPAEGYAIMVFA